jgi:dsDNA-binding SOS-regulon protein
MSKDKKQRENEYDKKLAIKGTLDEVLKVSVPVKKEIKK